MTQINGQSHPRAAAYHAVRAPVAALDGDRTTRMTAFVDLLWNALAPTGVSWLGFYSPQRAADGTTEALVLGPCRDKPACSPIGLHGACGQCLLSRGPVLVEDVRVLGENYVACDPRDLSEVVVPVLDGTGQGYAVLDLDSFDIAAFDQRDVAALTELLVLARLSVVGDPRD